MRATVFVVIDDAERRRSVRQLAESGGLHAESWENADAFLAAFDPHAAGCVVYGVCGSIASGPGFLERVRATGAEIPVLLVTGRGDVPAAVDGMKAGASDVFEQSADEQDLLARLRRAIDRDAVDRAARADRIRVARRFQSLTERERHILYLVADGRSNREIADFFGVKPKTIEAQRASMMQKMRAAGVAQLVRMLLSLPRELTESADPTAAAPVDPRDASADAGRVTSARPDA